MSDDAFETRIAAGDLPPLVEGSAPEAEMLARLAGRLAAAMIAALTARSAGSNVTVNIATPDTDSFRRSEAYLAGQIARAVARGQRVL